MGGELIRSLNSALAQQFREAENDILKVFSSRGREVRIVQKGSFTFNLEGSGDPSSKYYSRRPSVPSYNSGVTIGRGFDLSAWSRSDIDSFLSAAKIDREYINWAKQASGLRGPAAVRYVKTYSVRDLSAREELDLFEYVYQFLERETENVLISPLIQKGFRVEFWKDMDGQLKELLVDMRYRGDFSREIRNSLESIIVHRDYALLESYFNDRAYWLEENGVPRERYLARARLAKELAAKFSY